MRRYETLAHTADTGIIAYGVTLLELFENAAFGMFDLMFELCAVKPERDHPVVADGDHIDDLLVAWLGELLYLSETESSVFCTFVVDRLEEGGVQGAAGGARFDGIELRGPPIKAVTWHDLAVVEVPDGFWARVLFDV